jgi:hypothetical protein
MGNYRQSENRLKAVPIERSEGLRGFLLDYKKLKTFRVRFWRC